MATTTATQPVLQSGKWNRKAGRYDFKRFDHMSSTGVSIAHDTIGKVIVDIKFLFRRSQWGTLGQDQNPAGIIYMDLNFTQPKGHKLVSATIKVTLDDEDVGLDPYRDSSLVHSDRPVQITEWYGPKQFGGAMKMAHINRTINLTPEANVLGNGGGGLGVNFIKSFVHTSKWTFQGSLHPGPTGPSWAYRTLKWDMTENDLEKHPLHANKVHTAFAFENSGQPFLMKVEIDGTLEKMSDRLKEKAKKKFGPRPRKEQDISSTLVGAFYGRRRPLDELAQGLERAMELQNRNSVPTEMPDSIQPTYYEVPYDPTASTSPAAIGTTGPPGGMLSPNQPQMQIEDGEAVGLLEDRSLPIDRTEPTLANLANVGDFFNVPIRRQPPPARQELIPDDISEMSEHTSAATLVDSQAGSRHTQEPEVEAEPARPQRPKPAAPAKNTKPSKLTIAKKNDDQEVMAKALEIAFLRVFVRFIMSILNYWDSATSSMSNDTGQGEDERNGQSDEDEEEEDERPKRISKHRKKQSHTSSAVETRATPVKRRHGRRRRGSDASL